MNAFWSLAARDWPPSYPAHQLTRTIGAAKVALLTSGGVLREEAIRHYGTVPCTSCRRDARVIYEALGAVAICTGDMECPAEDLGPAPFRVAMDAVDFAHRLAAAFHLDGAPGRGSVVIPLGRRKIGDEVVAVDLCTHPGRPEALELLTRLARGGPAVRVVVVPDSRRLHADAPTELAGVDLVWAGLDEVLTLDGGLRVDLRPVLARRAFRGVAAEAEGLVIDDRGARWAGRALLPAEETLTLRLLRLLASRLDECVSRRELWRGLWPDEHTKGGGIPRGANPDRFDNRLRIVVAELREALRDVGLDQALENQRGDEDAGGYRLVLPAVHVRAA